MVEYIKKHSRTILEILGLLGLVFAFLQVALQKQQFDYEKAQRPRLEYSQRLTFSESDFEIMSHTAQQLGEEFYELLYQYKGTNTDADYSSAVEAILPITSTISAKPVSVMIIINNKGAGTATKIRMVLEMDRPISSVNVESFEPYEIIKGGVGNSFVSVEIDRIVAEQSVKISIDSEKAKDTSQVDQLVLEENAQKNGVVSKIEYDEQGRLTTITELYSDSGLFPQIRYIPAEQPKVSVIVTSEEGPAQYLGLVEFGSSSRR